MKRWILPIIAVALAAVIAWPFLFGAGTAEVKGKTYSVEHLVSESNRYSPLRNRKPLAAGEAILCSWDRDRYLYFWSDGSRGWFDVLFLDAAGKILQVEQIRPFEGNDYLEDPGVASNVEARRALFLPGGAAQGVVPGESVALSSDLVNSTPEPMTQIKIGSKPVFVELADTPRLRGRGLMHRPYLSKGEGMLFIYPTERPGVNFYMRNTLMSLDIAFYDHSGKFVNVASTERAKNPRDGATVNAPAKGPAQFVLEVPIGWYQEQGLVDARVEFPESVKKRIEKAREHE